MISGNSSGVVCSKVIMVQFLPKAESCCSLVIFILVSVNFNDNTFLLFQVADLRGAWVRGQGLGQDHLRSRRSWAGNDVCRLSSLIKSVVRS